MSYSDDNDGGMLRQQANAYNDMNRFDQMHGAADSSDDDATAMRYGEVPAKRTAEDVLKQKNQILMDRLVKM